MIKNSGKYGMGTLSLHTAEGDHPFHSHAAPIYPTSTFSFPDVATGQAIWRGEQPGHIYTRLTNPNFDQLSEKITTLEAFDLMKQRIRVCRWVRSRPVLFFPQEWLL